MDAVLANALFKCFKCIFVYVKLLIIEVLNNINVKNSVKQSIHTVLQYVNSFGKKQSAIIHTW